MTFTENLKKAQSGDEYAYKLVCNEFAGGLYAVARLTLNTLEDAEAAVRNAFSDGFATIKQIKDHDHLRAWLAHELTKHMVACLKKYRDEGEPKLELSEEGSHLIQGLDHVESVYIIKARREIYGKLAGLDRLAASLHAVYGYDSREISIITGLSEEAAARKLANAEKTYSESDISEQTFFNLVRRIKAPESLYTPEKPRSIPFNAINSDDRKIAFSDISEPVPAPFEQDEAPAATEQESVEESVQEVEEAEPIEQISQIEQDKPVELQPEDTVQEKKTEEAVQKEEPKNPPREIDARMFIGIISAQHIKGGEFLRLMGNTRISNSAYREIEQNPSLTKERLITLLEESGLTTADYYKVLTAIKLQRDIDTASTRAFSPRELENLKAYDNIEVPPAKPPVIAPEHKPEPVPDLSVTTMLEKIPTEREEIKTPETPLVLPHETPKTAAAPTPDLSVTTMLEKIPTEREEIKTPEAPLVLPHEVQTTADAPAPDLSVTAMLGEIPTEREPAPAKPPVLTLEPKPNEADEKPYSPDEPEASKTPLVTQINENESREKYKSNEFFYDDDAYEPGVNNGKIAFCAVCAVLLLAGSFLCRYLTTGNVLPTDNPTENVVTEQKKTGISAEEIVTDEDVIAAMAKLTVNERRNSLDEYYVGQPYKNTLSSDFCEVGDTMYICNKGTISAVELGGGEPSLTAAVELKEKGEFIGFTADTEHIYALTRSENDVNGRKAVVVEIFDNKLKLLGRYAQDGDFAAVHENNGTLTVFTVLKSAGEENPLPTFTLDDESKTLTRSEIEIPDEIAYNGFTVFGTLSGTDVRTTAVLGGYDAYVSGEGDSFTLIIPDYNKTYLRTYRVVGITAELQAEETVDGELYGEECYNAEKGTLVAFDSVENCTKILKISEKSCDKIAEIGANETLKGAAFSDELTYIVTENADGAAVLYCCGADGEELTPDPEAVYSRRLSGYGDKLIGLSAQADENGARAGLRLSVYEYDKGLVELYGTDISVDEKTAAEYVRYLSGDAEENSALIAQNGDYIAVSCVYFDGVSEIERFLCFKDNSGELEAISDLLLFDVQSAYRYLTFHEETMYIVTASTVVTADLSTGKAVGYYQLTVDN